MPELEDTSTLVQQAGPVPGSVSLPVPGSVLGLVEEECLYPVSPRLLPSRSPYVQPRPLTSSQLKNILRSPAQTIQQLPQLNPSSQQSLIPLCSVQGTFLQSILTKNSNNTGVNSTLGNIQQRPLSLQHQQQQQQQQQQPRPSSISIPINVPTNYPQGLRTTSYNLQNLQQQLHQMQQLQPR